MSSGRWATDFARYTYSSLQSTIRSTAYYLLPLFYLTAAITLDCHQSIIVLDTGILWLVDSGPPLGLSVSKRMASHSSLAEHEQILYAADMKGRLRRPEAVTRKKLILPNS
jgi:hypothetical protein